ncbi:protein ACCELERATED CELL DEATH 6 [Gossypium australe]|uniref:Protein ACCELERATED CELL DEATH 6 n=1 Tax=Gossypium australe TaxID=47621 RepID=A0A5B6VEU2_9ROSI|nr:protein ACCELERATED CELL DEATH 6 [Gossypium australe]
MFTLLATFTFTAAFTIPGRFKNDEPNAGMAVLISKAAFKAFVISDSIAMTSSITAAVIVFWSSSRRDAESFMDTLPFAIGLTWISLIAMAIAFVSGLFVVLPKTLWLATLVCHRCLKGLKSLEPHIAKDNPFLFNVHLTRIFVQPQGHSACVGGFVVVAENANALLHLPAWTFSLCDSASL